MNSIDLGGSYLSVDYRYPTYLQFINTYILTPFT